MAKDAETVKAQESAERFRLLVDAVTDYGIVMLDPAGHVTSWNAGAQKLQQYAAEEIIGQHFSKFYTAEDVRDGKPDKALEHAKKNGSVQDEGWRVRKDGSRFWAACAMTPLYDADGTLFGFGKVTRDLTVKREAEARIRASEEQFRLLVERVQEYAIYLLDPNGRVMSWNSGAEKIKGFRADEIVGKHFACFYTAQDVAVGRPQRNLEAAARLGHIRDQGLRVRRDGTTFQADVVITALRDDHGNLRGFSKVTRDISDQVRTREIEAEKIAALKANQAKDEFLATLSHELRTPLTPALAAVSFMAERASELPEKFSNDIHIIHRNVQLEARIIDDLLDLTRISTGKIELHQQRIDAHAVVRDALNISQSQIHRKNLSVTQDLSATDHFVCGDPVRLEQVFWNLISNSVKFTGPGGEICLRSWNEEGELCVAVSDTGIGIEPGKQDKLFNAFEQGGSEMSRRLGGLGLGLAICKNLVELHGGTIAIESAGRGFGTTVTVTLTPSLHAAANLVAVQPANNGEQGGRRILLVEDHEDTRRVLAGLLRRFGYEVWEASGVQEALKTFSSQPVDAILSDIGLPDGTGYDVMSQARQTRHIRGVALTGYGMAEDVRRSKEAGFDFHLTKPVDVAELRTVLRKLDA